MARFSSLFSSSSGNCTFIGSGTGGILVDVGVSAKQALAALDCIGVDIADIGAIFVTHEHSDHIKGLRALASKNNIQVYTSAGTMQKLEEGGKLCNKFTCSVIPEDGVECRGMFVRPFRTSHDCAESLGFTVETPDERKISVLTDTGFVSDEMYHAVSGSDLILAESNHDIGMLRNGPYTYPLKRRILSDVGHLSNIACSELVKKLVEEGTTRIVLGHLSKENNMPILAYETSRGALAEINAKENEDYMMYVAGQGDVRTVVL
ncbi:MAG: MBL fold metallo-hydrolase [Clostridia bacterium]|nr:MBL fold metallo-hydrolase [Clostridia bacterium]